MRRCKGPRPDEGSRMSFWLAVRPFQGQTIANSGLVRFEGGGREEEILSGMYEGVKKRAEKNRDFVGEPSL